MDQKFILVTLLVKLGVSAAISAALVRSREFHSRLFREEGRSLRDTTILTIAIAIPYGLGVQVRHMVANFKAADLAFEATMITGVIGGVYAGVLGGVLMSIPAVIHGEYVTLPFNVVVGLIAGGLRELADYWADKEDIWSFSPFIDLTIFRWIKRNIPKPRMDWQIAFFVVILLLQFARMQLSLLFPGMLFSINSQEFWIFVAICAATVMCVAIPLKIWNNTRTELKLEEQTRLLLQARLDALQSQINPHFLFNTLNSVSSLVRIDPDTAREVIVKLANILRSLLRKHDAFCDLKEEVAFIDDYLDIEVIRFGRDKLRVNKELDPETLDYIVPSMLLQPLVENCIKHGLSPKIEGGSITLRSQLLNGKLQIQVQDDGVGMAAAAIESAHENGNAPRPGYSGIGMSNVAERMKVLYGEAGRMSITTPASGIGTVITLELPIVETELARSAADRIYSERSRTRA
ncbi:MAG: periplasmic sensor signal transduction histidine kinase [Acidobacteriales bacterium]|nr:periplasmic sensor signal transduction histidine kinase [Terriglobales bacterium]